MKADTMVHTMEHSPPTLLLVDDEVFILSAIKRLLRRDGYQILTAESGQEGLQVMETTSVDVIVSDQRMPGMTGVEFLREARKRFPSTIRIVLSGYTELQSVTDAINEGAVYKFLTKPWDDGHLRANIADAFRQRALQAENQRLHAQLQSTHAELLKAHAQLADLVCLQQKRLVQDEVVIGVSHEIFDAVAVPLMGVDGTGMVVLINAAAQQCFPMAVPGALIQDSPSLQPLARALQEATLPPALILASEDGPPWRATPRRFGAGSQGQGMLITFIPVQEAPCPSNP
ncbi:response regulator [Simplicispira lacusdiani]|uniref:response regulator n=1 Tax=Simplicispira lacusdiani TaxID=2213010 RepID=UPI00352103EC